ncbi:hypothetical protein ACVWXS_000284 [Lysinibacillus sp. TE18511]
MWVAFGRLQENAQSERKSTTRYDDEQLKSK